ncbi:MAG: hypothetical protein Q9181_005034, partial [Wetmoreana brouardii]
MPSPLTPLIAAISGLSSTGKSTIASYLPSVFPPPFYQLTILHVDDFYKPQARLPRREGLLDWDCADSIDWPRLGGAVRKWKEGEDVKHGIVNPQPDFATGGEHGIKQALVENLQDEASRATKPSVAGTELQRILLLDGFLLFTPSTPMSFRSLIDLKILLRAPYAEAKRRREARSGYQTMEGWWEDPPG